VEVEVEVALPLVVGEEQIIQLHVLIKAVLILVAIQPDTPSLHMKLTNTMEIMA
tara:strand:+ start:211 stop:372 length:162 start_codon:yes stop_codon:yes gene_type:complete